MIESDHLAEFAEGYPLSTAILREMGRQMPFLLKAAIESSGPPLRKRLPRLESIAAGLSAMAQQTDWIEQSVKSYVVLSLEFITLQRKLEKTGRYLLSNEREAFDRVYSSETGFYYLSGLLLSEALWPNHHRLVDLFDDFVSALAETARILEVGVGTGYHLQRMLQAKPKLDYVGVDISEIAVEYTRRFALSGSLKGSRAAFRICNAVEGIGEQDSSFDAAVCGEVLEHVERPDLLLREIHRVVKPGGRFFMTTVIFAANIDHIYLFEDAVSIRDLCASSDWILERELVLPIYASDPPDAKRRPMNYGAVLRKPDATGV